MPGVVDSIVNLGKKCVYCAMECAAIVYHWNMRMLRTRLKKLSQSSVHKDMKKAYGDLGAEVFALYKQGVTDIVNQPAVTNQLRSVERAEAKVMEAENAAQTIREDYERKKQAVKDAYRAKRAAVGGRRGPSSGGQGASEDE